MQLGNVVSTVTVCQLDARIVSENVALDRPEFDVIIE